MESVLRGISASINSFKHEIDAPIRDHLKNVYGCLTIASVAAAVGAYIQVYTSIVLPSLLTMFGGLGCISYVHFTQHHKNNISKRLGAFLGFAFLSGHSMGPLINYSIMLDPSIVVTALLCSTFIFASFSAAALLAKSGYFLMLSAPLGSVLTAYLVLSLGNLFFGSPLVFQLTLYLGLLLMCGFVLFDTTFIIEKRRRGDTDFIAHSIDLFIDFIGIFRRILIILMEKEKNERRRRKD